MKNIKTIIASVVSHLAEPSFNAGSCPSDKILNRNLKDLPTGFSRIKKHKRNKKTGY